MMSNKSGAKVTNYLETPSLSPCFFANGTDFCSIVVRCIQHNLAISVHLPHPFHGFRYVVGLHFHGCV